MARTEEEIEEIVRYFGYKFINSYIENHYRKVVIQDSIGYKYDVFLTNMMRGKVPDFVSNGNPKTLENIALWLNINNSEIVLCNTNVYKGSNHRLNLYHNICKEYFIMSWNQIKRGDNCPVCIGRQVGKRNSLSYLRPELAEEWDSIKNGELSPEDVTCGSGKKVWWLCQNGHGYAMKIIDRTNRFRSCPKCAFSKGEDRVENFLSENNITYRIQERFQNCKDKNALPFDFYLPDYNLCIEYHGEQHYKPSRFSSSVTKEQAEKNLEELIRRDNIKDKYCESNNISLLIISYKDFNAIENILKTVLL